MKRLLVLPLLGLLAACTALPLSISIPDYDSNVAANNTVITFQKTQQAQTPPSPAKSIAIEGKIIYSQSATLVFYASEEPPCGMQIGGVYSCSFNPDKMDKLGEITLQAWIPQNFVWQGAKLTGGINKNSLYIGVSLKDSLLTGGTLQFRNMIAKVAVF
ncbi:MAG TPA: hypothetical protein VFS50_16315 [Meiothermus sp.]|nr:hypothetical protein [Meiothermus sp.]